MSGPQFDFHPDMAEPPGGQGCIAAGRRCRHVAGRLEQLCGQHAAALSGRHGGWRYAAGLPRGGHGRANHGPVVLSAVGGLPSPSACVVYFCTAALSFIKGSLDSGDPIAWGIADQARAVVVGVDYRGWRRTISSRREWSDCYAVLKHLATYAPALGIDAARLALWGDSAGGNMAAAVCLYGA